MLSYSIFVKTGNILRYSLIILFFIILDLLNMQVNMFSSLSRLEVVVRNNKMKNYME